MNIDHVHFYVEDARYWQDWFVQKLGFQIISAQISHHTWTVGVGQGPICFYLSSPQTDDSPIAAYLRRHPAGVADLAFQVVDLTTLIERAVDLGVKVLQPIQWVQVGQRWQKTAKIQGWGDLQHTLIEETLPPLRPRDPLESNVGSQSKTDCPDASRVDCGAWLGIDHIVLNVNPGDLQAAVSWYEAVFGFQRRQNFVIQTEHSALYSQVLIHPAGLVQFPINEPASPGSQIQEFLDYNRGSGIQHIALQTPRIVPLIAQLRQRGISFLQIPASYYEQLPHRAGFQLGATELQTITEQEVLVDWQPNPSASLLLQAFTHPIFTQPTFFFELIERRNSQPQTVRGFGEGNFQALFEAIEREQMKRGSLKVD